MALAEATINIDACIHHFNLVILNTFFQTITLNQLSLPEKRFDGIPRSKHLNAKRQFSIEASVMC
ncbi:hypothetical protein DERP_012571 [Dermatophagoides pteronyssinus]|uniref:Uncharacterized protein n=1 Tax=Dermatophagoides pteronyssinus TaxID=6956 RepID=A0ABQ8IV21_DERPT|nr:hypothetical protein DERP_012571 [Dermatophagoides pteronyssinus]